MTYWDWVEESRGRIKRVARHFGITPAAVSNWRRNGVPPHRRQEVHALACGRVPLDQMHPEALGRRPVAERMERVDADRILLGIRGSLDSLLIQLQTLEKLTRDRLSATDEVDAGR